MTGTKFRFTEQQIEKLESNGKRTRYFDTYIPGLVLEITTAGKKSFRVYKKIPGRQNPVSVTLGYSPSISLESARRMARKVMADIAEGINPNDTKRQFRAASVTTLDAFKSFIESRELKPSTLRGYDQVMNCYLSDWHKKRLADINQTLILRRHRELSQKSRAQADLTMRVVRALFNFAKAEYKSSEGRSLFPNNPVDVLSEKRCWNKVKRKTTRLRGSQLKPFLAALNSIRDDAIIQRKDECVAFCDFIEFITYTGLRKTELLTLPWSQVHLEDRLYVLKDTKNGEDVEFPITSKLAEIFARRTEYKVSPYVFGKASGKGCLTEPKKTLAKICEIADVQITLHDLRRTFASIAESIGISGYLLKRLLNHLTDQSDVTSGYTILTAEELRGPSETVTTRITEYAKPLESEFTSSVDKIKNLIANLSKEEKVKLLSIFVI